jgi:hypothetical protein
VAPVGRRKAPPAVAEAKRLTQQYFRRTDDMKPGLGNGQCGSAGETPGGNIPREALFPRSFPSSGLETTSPNREPKRPPGAGRRGRPRCCSTRYGPSGVTSSGSAVNVSWDSGLFVPSDDERAHGWTIEQDHAVGPVIDDDLIDGWPWCDGGFEEWYFFSRLPRDLNLSAYCNWTGLSLADWAGLVNVPTGLDLRQQLEKAKPAAVVGMGDRLFAISSDAALLADFGQALKKV